MVRPFRRYLIVIWVCSLFSCYHGNPTESQHSSFPDSLPDLALSHCEAGPDIGVFSITFDSSGLFYFYDNPLTNNHSATSFDSLQSHLVNINCEDAKLGSFELANKNILVKLLQIYGDRYLLWGGYGATDYAPAYDGDYLLVFDKNYNFKRKYDHMYQGKDTNKVFADVSFYRDIYCLSLSKDSILYLSFLDSSLATTATFATTIHLKVNAIKSFAVNNKIYIFANNYNRASASRAYSIDEYEIDLSGHLLNSNRVCDSCYFNDVILDNGSFDLVGGRVRDTNTVPLLLSLSMNGTINWEYSRYVDFYMQTSFYGCTAYNGNLLVSSDKVILEINGEGKPISKVLLGWPRQMYVTSSKLLVTIGD